MSAAHNIDTNTAPHHQRWRLLNCPLTSSSPLTYSFLYCLRPFQMNVGPEFIYCVCIWLLLCMLQLELEIVDYTVNCVHRQRFLGVFLSPFSDVQSRIMPVFNASGPQCCLRTWRPHTSSFDLRPCPLHTDTPPDSLNLLIWCTVDGGIFKVGDRWTETLSLWNAPFISSHVTDLLPMNLVSCQLLLHFLNFYLHQLLFQTFVAPVPSFLRCVAAIKVKMS